MALLVYMHCKLNCMFFNSAHKVKLVDLFKTMELLNSRYAFYMLGRGGAEPLLLLLLLLLLFQ